MVSPFNMLKINNGFAKLRYLFLDLSTAFMVTEVQFRFNAQTQILFHYSCDCILFTKLSSNILMRFINQIKKKFNKSL